MSKCAQVVALAVFAAGGMANATKATVLDENTPRNLTLSPAVAGATPLAYLVSKKLGQEVEPAFEDHDHDNGNDHDHAHTPTQPPAQLGVSEGSFRA
jgi:hypothetical protein